MPISDFRIPHSEHFAFLAWWLAPLIGLALVLSTSYNALSARRFDYGNKITAEMLPGQSYGQTFVARYPDLTGVELHLATGPGPARTSVVLHLRSSPADRHDVATARMQAGTSLGANPWYLFSFPPISDSQGKTFYIEAESPDGKPGRAISLLWWQPSPEGDPYANGNAYKDDRAQQGDLAFGLRYAASPLQVWAQLASAASGNFPPTLVWFLPLLGALGALAILWRIGRTGLLSRAGERLLRWSLPIALGVALIHGFLYIFLVPPWQGPDEHAHFAYVALLDRHNLDDNLVKRLRFDAQDNDVALANTISDSMTRNNFTRYWPGFPLPGTRINAEPTYYWAVNKSPSYYWLCAITLRAARAAGLSADPYQDPESALRLMRGVSLALNLLVVALAWLAGTLIYRGRRSWMLMLLPLTVALLPMHTFSASMVNNDILAEVAVTALFVALIALLRWPDGLRGVALAVLVLLLAYFGSEWTKSTAMAAGIPLAGLGLLIWVGMRVSRRLIPHSAFQLLALLLLALGAVTPLLALEPQNYVLGWQALQSPIVRLPRVKTPTAHDGSYVIELGPVPGEPRATVAQVLIPPVVHPAMDISVSGWVRLSPQASKSAANPPKAILLIEDASDRVGRGEVPLVSPGVWMPISTTGHVGARMSTVLIRLKSADAIAEFDDFSLRVTGVVGPWQDPVYQPRLLNPSAEDGVIGLRPALAERMPWRVAQTIDVLLNPQPFNKLALSWYYATEQYKSFWGDFGWLAVPLPDVLYELLGVLVAAALFGLAVAGMRRRGCWRADEWLGLTSVIAFIAAVFLAFAQQMMSLATVGQAAPLQGRYLFVFIVPLAWLLLAGARTTWSCLAHRTTGRSAKSSSQAQAEAPAKALELLSPVYDRGPVIGAGLGVWLWVNCLIALASYCLLSLIAPFYYG